MRNTDLQRFYLISSLSQLTLARGELTLRIEDWWISVKSDQLDRSPEVLLGDPLLESLLVEGLTNFSELIFSGFLGYELSEEELSRCWIASFLSHLLARIEDQDES